ncbi:MAG: hypothetical protein ACD_23C01388G0004 [uncultured bacterium]|nr:MAG: hypothetical protein ACD_23C01388G0004 [uncultured bacterium]
MLVRRIAVLDSAGIQHTVQEWGDFMRFQFADNTWSEWSRSGGRLLRGREHINPTDSDNVLEVAMTGEKLTVVQATE